MTWARLRDRFWTKEMSIELHPQDAGVGEGARARREAAEARVDGRGGVRRGVRPAGVQFNRLLRTALTSALNLALSHNQKTRPLMHP